VTVNSGIVTIAGHADGCVLALHLLGAVHCVEGVVAVRDRLSYSQARQQQ
jgi:hypothetical protein